MPGRHGSDANSDFSGVYRLGPPTTTTTHTPPREIRGARLPSAPGMGGFLPLYKMRAIFLVLPREVVWMSMSALGVLDAQPSIFFKLLHVTGYGNRRGADGRLPGHRTGCAG